MIDYLIVGSGLYGSTLAYELHKAGKKVLVIDKRNHIGGNCYTETVEGVEVHKYGSHYFHTNNKKVWNYINQFSEFYSNSPRTKVFYKGKFYSFPINLMTLHQLWNVKTPQEAKEKLEEKKIKFDQITNFEEYCLSHVGEEIYEIFFKGYTQKQWNRHPSKLPVSIIKKLPIRTTFDDSYHIHQMYHGVPVDGYTKIFEKMLNGIPVDLNVNFKDIKDNWQNMSKNIIYSGCIDEFFDYQYGHLEYRSLRHEFKIVDDDYQGCTQINYPDVDVPYTRIVEYKHFKPNNTSSKSVIQIEYPADYNKENEPFYPIHDNVNDLLFNKYQSLANKMNNVLIGGRLGCFRYLDMDQIVAMAMNNFAKLMK